MKPADIQETRPVHIQVIERKALPPAPASVVGYGPSLPSMDLEKFNCAMPGCDNVIYARPFDEGSGPFLCSSKCVHRWMTFNFLHGGSARVVE